MWDWFIHFVFEVIIPGLLLTPILICFAHYGTQQAQEDEKHYDNEPYDSYKNI